MKKRLTRGEKWLFASPLLFLVIAGVVLMRQRAAPYSIELPVESYVDALEFSPDSGRLLVSYIDDTRLSTSQVYDLEARAKVCDLEAPASLVSGGRKGRYYRWMSWSGDGNSIVGNSPDTFMASAVAVLGKNDSISIWDARTGLVKADFASVPTHRFWFGGDLRLSSDGKTLIGDGVPPLRYDATTGQPLGKPVVPRFGIGSIFNEKLGLVAVSESEKNLRVVEANTKRELWRPRLGTLTQYNWNGDVFYVRDLFQTGKGEGAITRSRLLLWDGKTRQQLLSPPLAPNANISDFNFSPDGKTVFYNQETTKTQQVFAGVTGESHESHLVCYDYRANRIVWSYAAKPRFEALLPSPDGKWLAAQGDLESSPRLCVFDRRGQLKYQFESTLLPVKWSPDSKKLTFFVMEKDDSEKTISTRLEIHRFKD